MESVSNKKAMNETTEQSKIEPRLAAAKHSISVFVAVQNKRKFVPYGIEKNLCCR